MATLPDVVVPFDDFISVNTESGIAVGTAITIQLKTTSWVRLVESSSKPDPSVTNIGVILSNLSYPYAIADITSGSEEIWAISTREGQGASLNVQEL